MKITEIRVGMSRTVDIRPYYSRRFELGVTIELTDDDDVKACQQAMLQELNWQLEELEQSARAEADPSQIAPVPPAPLPPQPVQQSQNGHTEDPTTQARQEIAELLSNIPHGNHPALSQPVADRLGASLQRRGWQGLDDIKGVATTLLNRRIEEVWDVKEHEAKAITLWLDKASDELLDALWPPVEAK